ncbi:FAD/NAD(P)-binding protein [Candidatus Falkowbacteria bacterium]|jgi:NAD(P)H-flavin reductase|nr:FAD/NAD(P)-binding protein [Candidatus Falkowbacteria bacterium]MBT6574309.1 FAD/NAD(P)-binding protein [Candidatus Falkowbacteria bacterium]MBT7348254.1 FAD/NAD(P)-binding protein [Candidatus Falkowbacteria bacterium]MBT7500233.1 FAD/NAD(P)-binding protein [Candidatus Falkowbacteria bacterium]
MKNQYALQPAKVIKVVKENSITNTFYFSLDKQNELKFLAGQFMQIGLPGFGECPISISSSPKLSDKHFCLTIRSVGELTAKLNNLKVGDKAFVRGPFGNGFPEVTKNLILIGGGCGFIPLRSVFEENRNRKDIKLQVLVGCSTQESLVFKREYSKIKNKHDFGLILENETIPGFAKQKGFVTDLIKKKKLLKNSLVFVCGPAIMYKFVVKELLAKKVEPANMYFSLEKRMHCGVGVCQHCAIGSKYICKDGPVFNYEFLRSVNYF